MDIVCPLDARDDIATLVDAGADCFYAGVEESVLFGEAQQDRGAVASCRPGGRANFPSLDELVAAGEQARAHGKRLLLTVNAPHYSDRQTEQIVKFVRGCDAVTAYIISDIGLIAALREGGGEVQLIASTGAHVLNRAAVTFYSRFGIREVVVPRHLSLKEIGELVASHPDVRFECFIKNEDCQFIQGVCYYSHSRNSEACIDSSCRSVSIDASTNPEIPLADGVRSLRERIYNECGLCAIREMSMLGVAGVKIVGRGRKPKHKLRDVRLVRFALDHTALEQDDFERRVRREYAAANDVPCGRDCMYGD